MFKKRAGKFLLVAMALALVVATFAGCGQKSGSSSTPQIVKYNLGDSDPATIDPALNQAVDGATIIVNAFDGLTRINSQGQPVAAVASSWDISKDGLTYTFHLRPGVKWSDGKPVTAQDFEYAWKRALAPATASAYAYQMYYLKNAEAYNNGKATADSVGVKATNDSTLVVTLQNPCSYFLQLTAFPTYMPVRKDVVEANPTTWANNPSTYITDGPFKLQSWTHKEKLVFVKNDNYWNAKAIKLSEIDYYCLDQPASYMAAYTSGQVDIIEAPPTSQIPTLIKNGTAKVYPYIGTYYLDFNLTGKASSPAANKALQNVDVRKALNLAINRQEIVQDVTKGGEQPATSFVPSGTLNTAGTGDFKDKSYFPATGDVAQAQQLLAEAGYPGGKGFPSITLMYNSGGANQDVMTAVQDMWLKNLGIHVNLASQEWKVFQATRNNGQYDIARDGWLADYNNPMTFLDLFTTSSGNNAPHYSNPKYDALINQALAASNPTTADTDMHQAEDILMQDMPVAPIYYYTNVACIKPYVKDVYLSPLGFIYFDNTYIQK